MTGKRRNAIPLREQRRVTLLKLFQQLAAKVEVDPTGPNVQAFLKVDERLAQFDETKPAQASGAAKERLGKYRVVR